MTLKYVLAWLPLVVIAVLNGTIRQFVYGTFVSELTAHQISTLIGISLFAVYIWFITRTWKIRSAAEAWYIGFTWLAMTIVFEFGFGHYVMGNSWEMLFHDYNLFSGRVWLLVLIWTTIAPYLFFRYHSK